HGDVGETRIDGGCRVLSVWAVKPELDEGHPLVQRLILGWAAIEAAGQIERAVLDREAPAQDFDAGRHNCIKSPGEKTGRERHRASRSNRYFVHERPCHGKWPQPGQRIRQITKAFAEEQARLNRVRRVRAYPTRA